MTINVPSAPSINEQSVRTNTVDTVFVSRFINGMINIPSEMRLRFRTINGAPAIEVSFAYFIKEKRQILKLSSMANESLIDAVIAAMGSNLKPIQKFKEEGNKDVVETTKNFELEMFETFIRSYYQLKIEDDFISPRGDRFLHAIFSIGYRNNIHFYIKRDEHIEELLNEAFAPKTV